MSDRRTFLQRALALGAGVVGSPALFSQRSFAEPENPHRHHVAARGGFNVPAQTPDIPDLPFTLDNGVKVFHLVAEPVKQQLTPEKVITAWGYNGSAPGPTIQVNQGDRVRIIVDNHLPEATSMHWHGFEVPIAMDGGPGISQPPIKPGGRFIYEFTLHQEGTYFYHSHMAMQEMMGMLGAFIMHPKNPERPSPDKDFVIMMQEYSVLPNSVVPNSMNMEFNWLVFNGKSGPATTPLIVRLGDRVRIRMINLGMDHHPVHLHGHTFQVTGTEGGRIPVSAWMPGNTVLVGVAQARDIEFVANNPGDWMLHCHLPHHMMNQMTSNVGPISRNVSGNDDIAPNANSVPGFPQDAYMEGPMMAMDKMVEKPENYGLPPGWSGFMQGMMTFVRVLPPKEYDEVMRRVNKNSKRSTPMSGMDHSNG